MHAEIKEVCALATMRNAELTSRRVKGNDGGKSSREWAGTKQESRFVEISMTCIVKGVKTANKSTPQVKYITSKQSARDNGACR